MFVDFDKEGWEWYCPDSWLLYCTLTLTKEDDEDIFFKASDLILREFEKISGKFVSIGLVKITFPVDEIFTVELSTTKKNSQLCNFGAQRNNENPGRGF